MLIVNISYVVVCLLVFQIKPFDAHVLQPTDTKIKHALFGGGNIYIYIYISIKSTPHANRRLGSCCFSSGAAHPAHGPHLSLHQHPSSRGLISSAN